MSNFGKKIKKNINKNLYTEEERFALQIPEYYSYVFMKLLKDNEKSLDKEFTSEFHRSFFKSKEKKEFYGEEAWELMLSYSKAVELRLEAILKEHSVSFWIQVYRRIGLGIVSDLNRPTHEYNLFHLREITELAIIKYGNIDGEDIQNTKDISDDKVLGGLFKQYYQELLKENYNDIYQYILAKNTQVVTEFNAHDYINIYIVERFALEYWWSTAVMRAIGKGASIYIDEDNTVKEKRTDELNFLLESYDKRIQNEAFSTSNIGISFFNSKEAFKMPCPQYNYQHLDMKDVDIFYKTFKCNFKLELTPNFYWAMIDIEKYIETYKFLDEELIKKYAFSVTQIAIYITLLHFGAFINTLDIKKKKLNLIPHFNLYQRAYLISNNVDDLNDNIIELYKVVESKQKFKKGLLNQEIVKKISDFLTLDTSKKQNNISLWSGGPKYIFFKSNKSILVNFVSSASILEKLFFGIKVNNEKGTIFEDNFRDYIIENNFNLLDIRNIKNFNNEEREIDLAIKIKNTLILIECRAIEKPLDFEIGKIKTFKKRKEELDSKINQVLTLNDFIMKNKKGKNYDFSWAEKIIPIVATPFIEWIGSLEEKYWIDKDIPRILHPEEIMKLMKSGLLK